MENKIVNISIEVFKAIEEKVGKEDKNFYENLYKEAHDWNAFITSSGLINTLLFGFNRAVNNEDTQKGKISPESVLSAVALEILSKDLEEFSVKEVNLNLSLLSERWKDFIGLLTEISQLEKGLEKQIIFQEFLTHFSRLAKVKAFALNGRENSGNEG